MELPELLSEIGFSEYEKAVYLALIKLGKSKAYKISKYSKVPSGKVYEVLNQLKEKDFVTVLPTFPKTYAVVDIKKAVKEYIETKKEKLQQIDSELQKMKIDKKESNEQVEESFYVTYGLRNSFKEIYRFFETAKKETCSIAGNFNLTPRARQVSLDALKRHIKQRVMIKQLTPNNMDVIKEFLSLGIKIRLQPYQFTGLRIFVKDDDESYMSIVDPEDEKNRVNLVVHHKEFTKNLKNLFETIWSKGKEIKF